MYIKYLWLNCNNGIIYKLFWFYYTFITNQIFKIETLKIGNFCFTIAPFSVYRDRLFYFIDKDTESSVISSRCGGGMVEDNLITSAALKLSRGMNWGDRLQGCSKRQWVLEVWGFFGSVRGWGALGCQKSSVREDWGLAWLNLLCVG